MASSQAQLEIYNLALSHVGSKSVTAPEDSPECQLHYPTLRVKALTWYQWTFATFVKELVAITDNEGEKLGALGEFRFLYRLPNTPAVLRTLRMWPTGARYQRRQWLPPSDPEHPQPVIASSADSVVLEYIGDVNEGLWLPAFVDMVGLWLAVMISNRLARRPQLRQTLMAELAETRQRLIDIDGHQDSPPRAMRNQTYIAGRQESGVPPMEQGIQEPLSEPF